MSIASSGGALPAEFAREVASFVLAEIQRRGIVTPEYLDSAQASVYLGMSQDWLAKARSDGGGPNYSKVSGSRGGAVRYKRTDLDKFMAARRTGGGR
ncbi:MAG: helix-turn-helix domain-containing protein [Phycisphaeraceae bacterium]|nr:helix-turn-helix domain-containing protein [Phycisphaeraceae bacterium]MCW5753293.1 helix-turn-helix domain-containing protein [Phycisphaeraceae bacterium]